ncbi:MAG: iron ABC transporter permease [Xanthobacteraceae bacterium]|nr:iron ABC transporter permease [Xanthobacteraceae bacterium]
MLPNRRAFVQGVLLAAVHAKTSLAQGFAGLGIEAGAFEPVVKGRALTFPADHGPHPRFRIEWWYVTANLHDGAGTPYGVQWTLFRQAMEAGPDAENWASRQIWMGHAAVTSASEHHFGERLARGGIGQAGADAEPFHVWIDAWDMRGLDAMSAQTISPLVLTASANDFAFDLKLEASQALVLQGDAGYSQKSDKGQASYYYSQPFFKARGEIELSGHRVQVTGQAWMDREWSSQPLASDQKGWDWISLHLDSGTKLMLFRLRQSDGKNFISGNWIGADGLSEVLASNMIALTPASQNSIEGRMLPTEWDIEIPSRGLKIKIVSLNPQSWMATTIPYWEGPVRIHGSQSGVGYLEMTGY